MNSHYRRLFAVLAAICAIPAVADAQNTAYGTKALTHNTTGTGNSAFGYDALFANTSGGANTAVGNQALYSNTTGIENSALGLWALAYNTTGNANTASGTAALGSNTTGAKNAATGYYALGSNTTGYYNSAVGTKSLYSNTSGYCNTAIGYYSLYAVTTGFNNVALGYNAGTNVTSGNHNIEIGNTGLKSDSTLIRIGAQGLQNATYIAGISGIGVTGGVGVYINANGQLGTVTSSRRFKRDIHDMGNVSDKLMQLRPVTFRYKQAAENGTRPLQYGLIAEEVAKVYPDLVQYDKQGKPFTIYYHLLTPMILSALQKEHHQTVAMKLAHNTQIAALSAHMTALTLAHEQDRAQIALQDKKIAVLMASHSEDRAEIASLKQTLARLATYVESVRNAAPVQKAVFTPR